jgi:hypothetical protein
MNNKKKYIGNDPNPTNADPVAKQVAQNYIDKYKEQKNQHEEPLNQLSKGNICSEEKKNLDMHNDSISRNLQGQAIEIHGHKKTETIMAKFENTDGSLANEVVTSADTPSSEQDRDEYYDDFDFLSGGRDESFLPNQNNTSQAISNQENTTIDTAVTDNDVATEAVTTEAIQEDNSTNIDNNNNEENSLSNNSSSVLDKRSKKNDDDDNDGKGSGPTATGESSSNDVTGLGDSTHRSNFRTLLENVSFILINIISSIIDSLNEILTLM